MKRIKADRPGRWSKRCKHPYCTDCNTKRGKNRGNRNIRHAAKAALSKLRREQ